MRHNVMTSNTTKDWIRPDDGIGRVTLNDVVTEVTFDSVTVRIDGNDNPPYANAANNAAFDFNSLTIAIAWSGVVVVVGEGGSGVGGGRRESNSESFGLSSSPLVD